MERGPKFRPDGKKNLVTASTAGLYDVIEAFTNTAKPFSGKVVGIKERVPKGSPEGTMPQVVAIIVKSGDEKRSLGAGTTIQFLSRAAINLTSSPELEFQGDQDPFEEYFRPIGSMPNETE